ncbi:hypothetical protein K458DRAFT_354689 [Lentithecium fluviatile CBS 122367]|uniref:Rhodopsin domain-containing protein n=1 Tax=Lentithecium fluviatile CBS 122367 TaxID=1168545 RepID=A0A6G1JJ41_9PLEO|nr:hypothetical protein K458DRAFT_354689 [Lentithecium fluviatile CBS 122367]
MSQGNEDKKAYSVGNYFKYAAPGEIIAAGAVLSALSVIVVGVRIWSRIHHKTKVGIDDYLIIPAMLLVCGMAAALINGVDRGAVGYPTPPPPSADPNLVLTYRDPKISLVQKTQFITQILMIASYGFCKLSIIFFYRRIFVVSKKDLFDLMTKGMAILTSAWTIAYLFAMAFNCGTRFWAHWGSYLDLFTYCVGSYHIYESLLISDFILDVIILVLPLPMVWRLHLTLIKKVAITGIFLLGTMATAAAAARLAIFISQINRGFDPTLDVNQSVSTVMYWSMIEAGICIVAACLPTMQRLLRGQSITSVVNSIRSAISLPSFTGSGQRSSGSRSRSRLPPYSGQNGASSNASAQGFARMEERNSEEPPVPLMNVKGGIGKTTTTTVETESRSEHSVGAWNTV